MHKLEIFGNRLKKLNIDIKLLGNYPWVYIDEINGKRVKEKFDSEHGFVIMYRGKNEEFLDITELFKLIRKYKS